MKCPTCNIDLPEHAIFCNNCGCNIERTQELGPITFEPNPVIEPVGNAVLEHAKAQHMEKKNNQYTVIGCFAIALVVLAVLVAFIF